MNYPPQLQLVLQLSSAVPSSLQYLWPPLLSEPPLNGQLAPDMLKPPEWRQEAARILETFYFLALLQPSPEPSCSELPLGPCWQLLA